MSRWSPPAAPRRVLVLLDTLLPGGAERIAVELAAAVDRNRYDVRVIATKTGGPLEQTLASSGIPYVVLGRSPADGPPSRVRARPGCAGPRSRPLPPVREQRLGRARGAHDRRPADRPRAQPRQAPLAARAPARPVADLPHRLPNRLRLRQRRPLARPERSAAGKAPRGAQRRAAGHRAPAGAGSARAWPRRGGAGCRRRGKFPA